MKNDRHLFSLNRRQILPALAGAAVLAGVQGARSADQPTQSQPAPTRDDILIRGASILTMDPQNPIVEGGDILIRSGRIAAVGHSIDAPDAEVIDATDLIALPGFVNAHIHLWQSALSGIAGDWSLDQYVQRILGGIGPHIGAEDLYLANLAGCFEQVSAGTTTVFDYCHAINTPAHADRAVDALLESGIRSVFGYGPPGDWDWYADPNRDHPEDAARLRKERLSSDSGLVRMALAIRGPDESTLPATMRDIAMARRLGVIVTMHTGWGTVGPKNKAARQLADAGLLGPDINLVHANSFTASEYKAVVDSGATITVTPEVEMQMGMGFPATGHVRLAGGRPAVGTDIPTNVGPEMATQIRFALQMQRALDNDRLLREGQEPKELTITAHEALEWATMAGARALGLDREIGSITPGKAADIQLIRKSPRDLGQAQNPAESVVFYSTAAQVESVFVNGKAQKWQGRLVNSAAHGLRDRLLQSGQRLIKQGQEKK